MAGGCNVLQTEKLRNKISTRKRIVDTTKQYSSTTTIHGISYLAGDDVSGVERLLWTIVVLFAIVLTTFQVVTLYNDWQDQPVITTLDTAALPIEEIEFPAVTICPQGSRQEMLESVLFRQLKKYIQNKESSLNATNRRLKRKVSETETFLTEDEMMAQVQEFIRDVYPGATEKPTMLINLMTSDNPELLIQNQAVLQLNRECDSSSNGPFTNAMNKQLRKDSCPEDFDLAQKSSFCIHAKSTPMTYNDATKYCHSLSGSKLFYMDNLDDLSPLDELLEVSGNTIFFNLSKTIIYTSTL